VRKSATTNDRFSTPLALLAIIVILCMVTELILRLSGSFATYAEKNGLGYISLYDLGAIKWFTALSPGQHTTATADYTETYSINTLGFRDDDWPLEKGAQEVRVLALGGSFVEGSGSLSLASSYPRQLGQRLQQQMGSDVSVRVLNGGIAGSDPVENLQALVRVFAQYRPDLIVQSLDEGDWKYDIALRGGLDRYNADGSISVQPPWFEPIYQHSHLARAFMTKVLGFNKGTLLSNAEREARIDRAVVEVCRVLAQESDIARSLDAHLAVVVMPDYSDVLDGVVSDRMLAVEQCAGQYAATVLNLGRELRQRVPGDALAQLYWPTDKHFKPEGYALYGQIVAEAVQPILAGHSDGAISGPAHGAAR
jgi:hypothetical protein